jgi:hypothetical protein
MDIIYEYLKDNKNELWMIISYLSCQRKRLIAIAIKMY